MNTVSIMFRKCAIVLLFVVQLISGGEQNEQDNGEISPD